jgi:hypothetical protein
MSIFFIKEKKKRHYKIWLGKRKKIIEKLTRAYVKE